MRALSELKSCLDVTDEDIRAALAPARSLIEPGPRDRSFALVGRMADVATPWKGAPKILLVLAHIATRDWLDGDLVVKLIGDDELSVIELFVDDGLMRTRVLGPKRISTPFREFRAAVTLHGQLLLPLAVEGAVEERRVVLRTAHALRSASIPPSFSAVSASLLPMVGGGDRPLPNIISRAPPRTASVPELPALQLPSETLTITESDPSAQRPKYKPMSLPPHMKHALAARKKP